MIGGGDRTRTRYLLLAKQPLSQLSYTPNSTRNSFKPEGRWTTMVGLVGLEPTTPALSTQCSNQLSYRPKPVTSSPSLRLVVSDNLPTTDKCERSNTLQFSRKEVIQPHLPIRLPCYDFTPVTNPAVVIALLAVRLTTSGRTRSHGVTGGVYKTRERIHRDILIHDY
jgi:hypothetical protein